MGNETSAQLEQNDQSPFSRLLPGQRGPPPGVVVVSGPNNQPSSSMGQTELDKLGKIPLFQPFIKSSVNLFGFESGSIDGSSSMGGPSNVLNSSIVSGSVPPIDSRALASVSTRLQEHLRQCSEAVAFDQNALCNRMNEIDLSIAASHSCLAERHRRYTRLCEQLVQMREICATAAKVKVGVEQTHRGLYELNQLLPEDLRIEIPEPKGTLGKIVDSNNSSQRLKTVPHSSSMEVPTNSKRFFEAVANSSTSSSASSSQHPGGSEDRDRAPSSVSNVSSKCDEGGGTNEQPPIDEENEEQVDSDEKQTNTESP